MKNSLKVLLNVLAFSTLFITGCTISSLRTGEISLYKAHMQDAVSQSDRTANTFLLKDRGFSLSENANRILDAFGEQECVGPYRLSLELQRIVTEADRARRELLANQAENSPRYKKLEKLHDSAQALLTKISVRDDVTKHQTEECFDDAVEHLTITRNYLDELRDAIDQLKAAFHNTAVDPWFSFDIIFQVAGRPLVKDDWQTVKPGKTKNGVPAWQVTTHSDNPSNTFYGHILKNDRLFEDQINTPVSAAAILLIDNNTDRDRIKNELALLKPLVRNILERSLDVSDAVRHTLHHVDVAWDDTLEVTHEPYSRVIDLLYLDIQKSQMLIQQILDQLKKPMRTRANRVSAEREEAQQYCRDSAILANRNMHHKLLAAASESDTPTHVTLELKTLFLRFLGNGESNEPSQKHDANLLVTCTVKTAQNKEDAIYPLIFEEHYAPGHFVNRLDRIAYGPTPYLGQFFDVRFVVTDVRDIGNKSILDGISGAVSLVSSLNPEFAAISPMVTSLFSTIVKTANKDATELDFSFTIPGPEGADKADVDFLVAETGHYIIMKKENRYRNESKGNYEGALSPKGKGESAQTNKNNEDRGLWAERMLYKRLIYDPADGKLYWRNNLTTPTANFTKDNLFLDQTYAVLVVTDEYTKEDELGGVLRQGVSKALGDARARDVIPDMSTAGDMIQKFRDARHEKTKTAIAPGILTPPTPAQLAARLNQFKIEQAKLWNAGTDLQKQLVIEGLYDNADAETQELLGKDLENWKKAKLTVPSVGSIPEVKLHGTLP